MTPRTSWGSWRALGELWGVAGAPQVGFGTFWGNLGASLGGVQSILLGGKCVTNTWVLEPARFLVTCRGVWIFFVFSMFFLSLIIVNRGGEFVVKPMKNEGLEFGPLRKCQEQHDENVGFGM